MFLLGSCEQGGGGKERGLQLKDRSIPSHYPTASPAGMHCHQKKYWKVFLCSSQPDLGPFELNFIYCLFLPDINFLNIPLDQCFSSLVTLRDTDFSSQNFVHIVCTRIRRLGKKFRALASRFLFYQQGHKKHLLFSSGKKVMCCISVCVSALCMLKQECIGKTGGSCVHSTQGHKTRNIPNNYLTAIPKGMQWGKNLESFSLALQNSY